MNERQKEVVQTQVDREKETLDLLKLVFGQAQDDCANKIIELSMRRDMENLQTIIWQKKYQEAIKGQLDGILDNLLDKEYKTVSDYLHDCYENGYIGTMYDLAGQDIPLIMPIDQKQVVRAVELDAKLTTKKRYTDEQGNRVSLYEKLGANVDELKKDIRFQLGRGIANGSSWNQIGAELAKGMKHTPFEKAMNRTVTIARTEGHRIQCQAAMDAQYKAKSAGADVLKQWDSTLDGRTRDTHRRLDGQIRETDELFEVDGKKAMYPGGFGDPSEDCNCRCAMLQRARWALDEDELDELKERAEFFGLDKTKDFEEFKEKYLGVTDEKQTDIFKITPNQQDYRKVTVSDGDSFESTRKGNKVTAKRLLNTHNELYLSEKEHLKPRQLHNIDMGLEECFADITKDMGNYIKPKVVIVNIEELSNDKIVLASFNATNNVLYVSGVTGLNDKIIGFQEEYAAHDDPLSTFYHELLHWKDAQDYVDQFGEIKNQREYLKWIREKSKIEVEKLEKQGYNINEISKYASQSLMEEEYDEVITEYRVKEWSERK